MDVWNSSSIGSSSSGEGGRRNVKSHVIFERETFVSFSMIMKSRWELAFTFYCLPLSFLLDRHITVENSCLSFSPKLLLRRRNTPSLALHLHVLCHFRTLDGSFDRPPVTCL